MDDHDIERIAIVGECRRHKAPVIRVGEAKHERFGKDEAPEIGLIPEFRARSPRRFNYRMYVTVSGPCW